MRATRRKTAVLVTVATLSATVLTGCSFSLSPTPQPQLAALALETAIAAGQQLGDYQLPADAQTPNPNEQNTKQLLPAQTEQLLAEIYRLCGHDDQGDTPDTCDEQAVVDAADKELKSIGVTHDTGATASPTQQRETTTSSGSPSSTTPRTQVDPSTLDHQHSVEALQEFAFYYIGLVPAESRIIVAEQYAERAKLLGNPLNPGALLDPEATPAGSTSPTLPTTAEVLDISTLSENDKQQASHVVAALDASAFGLGLALAHSSSPSLVAELTSARATAGKLHDEIARGLSDVPAADPAGYVLNDQPPIIDERSASQFAAALYNQRTQFYLSLLPEAESPHWCQLLMLLAANAAVHAQTVGAFNA